MELKKIFDKINAPNYFVLVEGMYDINLYLGMNEDMKKTIKYRADFEPLNIQGTKCIDVKQFKNNEFSTIQFSLNDENNYSLFEVFCEDLIDTVTKTKSLTKVYNSIINRYNQWKLMFTNPSNHILTELQIMGLIGEVLYLNTKLFYKYGVGNAIKGWTGQELTHKDFSFDDQWYEIKAINKNSKSVCISSIEQLDSEYNGNLIVIKLEKMSPQFNGITINKLINETLSKISSIEDRELFLNKISNMGYTPNPAYDNLVYIISNITKYCVNEDFPKIKMQSIDKSIVKVNYEIALHGLEQFIIEE